MSNHVEQATTITQFNCRYSVGTSEAEAMQEFNYQNPGSDMILETKGKSTVQHYQFLYQVLAAGMALATLYFASEGMESQLSGDPIINLALKALPILATAYVGISSQSRSNAYGKIHSFMITRGLGEVSIARRVSKFGNTLD